MWVGVCVWGVVGLYVALSGLELRDLLASAKYWN